MKEKKEAAFIRGIRVLVGLAILTAVEYAVSFLDNSSTLLLIIALFKAGLVLQYFMHISHLWSEEEDH